MKTKVKGRSIRELQKTLPWTVPYHRDFKASPLRHKDFGHAMTHALKALGNLAAFVDEADHAGNRIWPKEVRKYLADLVICAMRMAGTCPGRRIDLQRAVVERIKEKNQKPKR